jgi:phospholipase C
MRDAAAGIGASGVAGLGPLARVETRAKLPEPSQSGIEHIVAVMMENRSFDSYLGWRQAGSNHPTATASPR